jgi:acetyl-CoA synthetase
MPAPEYYNIGADIADKHAANGKWNDSAIIYSDEMGHDFTMTFGQLTQKSNQVANALVHRLGIQRGDRVALVVSQSPEAAILHAAIYKAGAVAVPLFVLFGPDALQYRLCDSGAKAVFVEPGKLDDVLSLVIADALPELRAVITAAPLSAFTPADPPPLTATGFAANSAHDSTPADAATGISCTRAELLSLSSLIAPASCEFTPVLTRADDPAVVIYTSGTTGPPKGALHAHRVLLGHLPGVEFPQNLFPQPRDVFWTPADWAWIGGLFDVLLPSLHHGVPVVAKRMRKFDPEQAFGVLERFRVRNAFMPPTALKMMRSVPAPQLKYRYDMRSIGSGGETLGEAILQWGVETFGLSINEFYGQTECNLVIGNCSVLGGTGSGGRGELSPEIRPGSMGKAMPGHVVDIVDEAGVPLTAPNAVGNIGVRMPHPVAFIEYLNNPAATAEKVVNNYLLTGDLGRRDADGYFWFVGRNDDVIKSAGYRIGPSEIEGCLLRHAAVANVAVVGVPDEIRGEAIKAFIVLAPTYTDVSANELRAELTQFVRSRLAQHQFPRHIEFVDALPMTTTGKVIRKDLKKAEYDKYERARRLAADSEPSL